MKFAGVIFLLLLVQAITLKAEIKLPAFFSENMVLQQKTKVKLWGTATANKTVTVYTGWNKKSYHALAAADGKWQLQIATPGAGGPYEITISEQNKIELKNILIGEVWLCSGQSNMDMPVKGYQNLPVLNSNDLLMESPNNQIRLFHIGQKYSSTPLADAGGSWQEANAASAQNFSAVGYQFALMLQKHLGVPVGMIQATWGGSAIEAWTDKATVLNVLKDSLNTDMAISKAVHQVPGNLYNGMIAPLTGYGIAGVIWYQGEQNRYNYYSYLALQLAMVRSWRATWQTGDWPFYYVQIAPMHYVKPHQAYWVPRLREAQLRLRDSLSNSGLAMSIDAGEDYNIHPANKTIISKRLAYLALGKTYHKTGIAFNGPRYLSHKMDKDTMRVSFTDVPLGMTTFGKKITQFELAGDDKVFYPATAVLKGTIVSVHSDSVKHPIAVRYAFKDWITGELYSTEGIPASPFRTDNW